MIVEMWRHEQFFSCAACRWEQLLQLARSHGWQPIGTSNAPKWSGLQELTAGALGKDARYPGSPEAREAIDFARELYAANWMAENIRRGYGPPPYPGAYYITAADASAFADALERGLPEAERQERELPRYQGLSTWFVNQAIKFARGGGFVFGDAD